MSDFTLVGGVEWCCVHHGLVDECNDNEQCDMADDTDCDIRPLFYGHRPCSCPQTDTYRQLDRECPVHGDEAEKQRRNSTADGTHLPVSYPKVTTDGEATP